MHKRIVFLCILLISLTACKDNAVKKQGYFEGRFTYMSSQAGGVLQHLAAHRGQTVKAGEKLFVINPHPDDFNLQSAKAEYQRDVAQLHDLLKGKRPEIIKNDWLALKSAEAQYKYAGQTLARQQALIKTDNTELATLNEAQQNYQVALSQLKQARQQIVIDRLSARIDQIQAADQAAHAAKAKMKQAHWLLSQKTVKAAQQAFVYDTFYYPGEVVPADSPVMALLTPRNTYALFFVNAKELAMLKLGETVSLHCQGCRGTKATISFIADRPEYTPPVIYSTTTEDHLVYRVEANPLGDKSQLHPGQPVTITFAKQAS